MAADPEFNPLTQYTLNLISTSPSEAIDTSYLHFCYELALETSAKCSSFYQVSQGS